LGDSQYCAQRFPTEQKEAIDPLRENFRHYRLKIRKSSANGQLHLVSNGLCKTDQGESV